MYIYIYSCNNVLHQVYEWKSQVNGGDTNNSEPVMFAWIQAIIVVNLADSYLERNNGSLLCF